jgi:hypothetical protein
MRRSKEWKRRNERGRAATERSCTTRKGGSKREKRKGRKEDGNPVWEEK